MDTFLTRRHLGCPERPTAEAWPYAGFGGRPCFCAAAGPSDALERFKGFFDEVHSRDPLCPAGEAWDRFVASCGADVPAVLELDLDPWAVSRQTLPAKPHRYKAPLTYVSASFGKHADSIGMSSVIGWPGVSRNDTDLFLVAARPIDKTLADTIKEVLPAAYKSLVEDGPEAGFDKMEEVLLPVLGEDTSFVLIIDSRVLTRHMAEFRSSKRIPGVILVTENCRREDINRSVRDIGTKEHSFPVQTGVHELAYCRLGVAPVSNRGVELTFGTSSGGDDATGEVSLCPGEEKTITLHTKDSGDREGVRWWWDTYTYTVRWVI